MSAVMFQRTPEPRKKREYPKAREIYRASRMSIAWDPGQYLRLSFFGAAAKFPSVSNNIMLTIPKGAMFKTLSMLRARYSPRLVEAALSQLKQLQPIKGTNQAHLEQLAAATMLWMDHRPAEFFPFTSSLDERVFFALLCDEQLRQTDTHNVLKSACDWSQRNGLVKNDKHMDAIALRTADFMPGASGTHFIFRPMSSCGAPIHALLDSMMKGDALKSAIPEAARKVQQAMF